MKVLIADDEIHICTLLKHLIDWEELGLELGGMFSGGQFWSTFPQRQPIF